MTRTYSGGSYIDFHEWIKNEKAAINPINKKHDKCFQQAVKVEQNYEEIKKNPQRITKVNFLQIDVAGKE